MARALSTTLVLALLAATAAAFALTEGVKLERTPVFGTKVSKTFSPACGCASAYAHVQFRLRSRQRLKVWIERDGGQRVRTLVPGTVYPRGGVGLTWDGLTDAGTTVADGVYRPVVKLVASHRTIVVPSMIVLDTKPPTITVRKPQFPLLSPDGDGRRDVFRVPYRIDERAQAILSVRGIQVALTLSRKPAGVLEWNGKLGMPSRPVVPGRYALRVAARDVAGNTSEAVPFAIAAVRYIALGRPRVVVRPGGRFAIRVSTDAPTVRFLLHGRRGLARRGTLHLRAPKRAGVYRLYVSANGHTATAAVVVA